MNLTEPQALNRIAAYCAKAERCEYDVRKRLAGWELTPEAVERIVKRLRDERFFDDARFCRSFINDKLKFNKWGKTKITYELRKRNISATVYASLLDEFSPDDYEERLLHILRVKEKSVKGNTLYDRKTKLIRFALGRGFTMEQTLKCLNKLFDEPSDEADFS